MVRGHDLRCGADAGQPPVNDARISHRIYHDVVGLQIVVNDAQPVHGCHCMHQQGRNVVVQLMNVVCIDHRPVHPFLQINPQIRHVYHAQPPQIGIHVCRRDVVSFHVDANLVKIFQIVSIQRVRFAQRSLHAEVFVVMFDAGQVSPNLLVFSHFVLGHCLFAEFANIAVMIIANPVLAFERRFKNAPLGTCKYGYATPFIATTGVIETVLWH